MFAFVFEGALFEFAKAKPAFAPLFALPLNKSPQERPTFIVYYFVTGESGRAARSPIIGLLAFRQEAEARAEVRMRKRGSVRRMRKSEARNRTVRRITAEKKPTEDCARCWNVRVVIITDVSC